MDEKIKKGGISVETEHIFPIIKKWLYSDKDIFLREIVSNACDAVTKLRRLTSLGQVSDIPDDYKITVKADREERTITVSDNGIGMTEEELDRYLCQIALSGALDFINKYEGEENRNNGIIGHFGLGFYSSFMVSDRVTVVTKSYTGAPAVKWECTDSGEYTLSPSDKETRGTDVIMHIKADETGEKYSTYLENWKLMMLIRKYSDYVRWPIVMDVEQSDWVDSGEKDENGEPKMEMVTKTEEQTINSMVPIWQRSRKEATDEECIAFYKDKFHDKDDPLAVIRVNAEGLISYRALLFIPAKAPANMFTRESDPGLELYSSGVMIMDKCTDLLPPCYAFARGVVDSPDLSLNISREMLQHDRQLKLIATNLGKKIKSELTKLMTNDREKYEQFHAAFGMMLRAGAVTETGDKVDEIKDLLLYHTSETKLVSLKEYVDAMPAEQTKIYFACGENVKRLLSLPQAEQLHEKGYDVLCMTSQIDEYFVDTMKTYADKPFCNIATDDLGLETEEEKKETEAKQAEDKDLLDFVKETLGDQVASVRLSNKLVSSAVCLSTEGGVTLEMERYFKSMPGAPTDIRAIRVLELNANHHAYQAMKEAFDAGDKDKAARIAKILHAQALLIAGEPLEDPAAYSELVCTLI